MKGRIDWKLLLAVLPLGLTELITCYRQIYGI